MPKNREVNIFRYLSYTEFLNSWLKIERENRKGFSLRSWAQELELTPAYISMLLNNKRPLTSKQFPRFIKSLRLNKKESDYFMALVEYQNESQPKKKEELFKALSNYRLFQENHPRDMILNKYLSKGIFVVLRELLEHRDFKLDPDWIHEQLDLRVKKSEISKAIKFLQNYGFIAKNENKKWQQTDFMIDCSREALRAAMGGFHREVSQWAADSIERVPRDERNLLAHVA